MGIAPAHGRVYGVIKYDDGLLIVALLVRVIAT